MSNRIYTDRHARNRACRQTDQKSCFEAASEFGMRPACRRVSGMRRQARAEQSRVAMFGGVTEE